MKAKLQCYIWCEGTDLCGGDRGGDGEVSDGHFTAGSPILALEELVQVLVCLLQLLELGIVVGCSSEHHWVL